MLPGETSVGMEYVLGIFPRESCRVFEGFRELGGVACSPRESLNDDLPSTPSACSRGL